MTDHITNCKSRYGGYFCELCTTCEHERDDWHQFTFPSGSRLEWDDAHAERKPVVASSGACSACGNYPADEEHECLAPQPELANVDRSKA